jgi:predicted Zn-dependent peptidase
MKKPKITILDNGLKIVSIHHYGPSTTVMALVSTGSKYETTENNGVSHFLEHMCFKGTSQRNGKDIMRYLEGLGAETNAFTSREITGYYVKAIHKHWKKTLAVVADIYVDSLFPDDEIQKEKGVIIGEISMYDDMPMSQVHDIFNQLTFENQPAGMTILGPKKAIKKMTRNQIVDYHNSHYVSSATTIVVTGNIEHKKIVAEVIKQFKNISVSKKSEKQKTINEFSEPKIKIHTKKTDQTHMILGYLSLDMKHKDAIILKMIATLLGGGMSSRLFERLREDLGVGYYVQAKNNAQTDTGIFEISCGVDSARTEEVISEIQNEILRIKKERITEDELKRVREYIIGNIQMGLESSDDIAYFYGKQFLFGLEPKSPRDLIAAYKKITAKDINRVANKIFKNERLFCALVGPHSSQQEISFKKTLFLK